ncbi:MAG: OmpA family protein [Gammaproteobacteria bacterium]|nr:OmpA family protein [Gammaproteobacteria bacterium]
MTTSVLHSDVVACANPGVLRRGVSRCWRGVALATAVCLASVGCQTTNPYTGEKEVNKTTKGAAVGAAAGAVVGALVSGKRKAVLLGAGIGALSGGAIGYYMDRQEAKLREQLRGTGVSVSRHEDTIILNMPGNVTFATNSSNVSGDFYPVLDSVALVINEFDQTYVDVIGHTDSRGAMEYNQRLSEQRAESVSQYLRSREVVAARVLSRGLGEEAPIASNDTAEGRALNRRVEIQLSPVT